MMDRLHVTACLTALLLILADSNISWPQAPAKGGESAKGGKKQTPALTADQQRALENLDRIALEARQIDNVATRTDLQSLIGDAVWDFDQSNARNIFLDAIKNARNIEDKRKSAALQTAVIKRIWSRDRTLAENLMKQLSEADSQKKEEASGDFGLSAQFGMKSGDPLAEQKLDLATSLLEENTGAAAELIAASLQKDVTFSGINLLSQLKSKDPETANQIFRGAVSQLPSMPATGAITAAIAMGNYVSPSCALCSQTTADAALAGPYYTAALQSLRRSLGQAYSPPPVKPELQARLVQYFHEMQAMLALTLSKFATPQDMAELETIYQQQLKTLEPGKQQKLQALRQMQNTTNRFDDLMQKMQSLPDQEQRDKALFSLVQAALRQEPAANSSNDLEETVEKIQSKELHDKAWSMLKSREVDQLAQSGELERAYALATKLTDPTIRAKALRKVFLAVKAQGSQVIRAADVLQQGLESLAKADASIESTQLMFTVSSDFANLKDFEGAFKALQASAESLGRLKRTDFEQTNTEAIANTLFDYRNTFGRLGGVDFDRAIFLAQSIKWREFKLAAEIATCRSILSRKA